MTDGPLPATADDSVGLLTSNGVLLARGRSVALWEPSSNEWTSLPDAPAEIDDLVGGDDFAISASANAVLDLNSQAWSTLPPPPLDLQRPSSVWTGSSLIVIGGPDTPFTDAAAISYDPVLDEWTTLPDIPDLSATATAAVWDGSRVIAAEYDMAAVAYDPLTDEWTQLPPVPARFFEWYPAMFSTGQTTLVAMAQAVVLLRNDAWFPLPAQALSDGGLSEIVPIAGSSGTFFVWSVDKDAAVNRLSAVDPNIVYSTTRTVQVGVAGLTLDDDTEPLAATYTTERGEQVMVELLVGDEACTMTSTYSAGGQDPTWEQINLSNDDADTPWRANPDATVLNTAPTTSDLVEIRCERPATTLELASRATFTLHVQRDD